MVWIHYFFKCVSLAYTNLNHRWCYGIQALCQNYPCVSYGRKMENLWRYLCATSSSSSVINICYASISAWVTILMVHLKSSLYLHNLSQRVTSLHHISILCLAINVIIHNPNQMKLQKNNYKKIQWHNNKNTNRWTEIIITEGFPIFISNFTDLNSSALRRSYQRYSVIYITCW